MPTSLPIDARYVAWNIKIFSAGVTDVIVNLVRRQNKKMCLEIEDDDIEC